jgi:hypothetical protein
LGRASEAQTVPSQSIFIDFPLLQVVERRQGRVLEEGWIPIGKQGEGDIAVIELEANAPSEARPATLARSTILTGHSFTAYGFPVANDRGIWVDGRIIDSVSGGWVQIEGVRLTGHAVERGFSGTPVWDRRLQAVVGMIVGRDLTPQAKTAFMIPTDILISVWPPLQPLENEPAQSPAQNMGRLLFKEELRRIDAAMPSQVVVDRPTELWVQVCRPGSPGFRSTLPQYTSAGEEISQRDVREGVLSLLFRIDAQTGNLQPVHARIELTARDFTLDDQHQDVQLQPRVDSGVITFGLVPNQVRRRSILHLTVKQQTPDGEMVTLGSVSLFTEVRSRDIDQGTDPAWTLASLTLSESASRAAMQSSIRSSDSAQDTTTPVPGRTSEEQRRIDKYLLLSESMLYSLIPPYMEESKGTAYTA